MAKLIDIAAVAFQLHMLFLENLVNLFDNVRGSGIEDLYHFVFSIHQEIQGLLFGRPLGITPLELL
jgi:hypothetical protein